jgi:hypothetical protein
MGRSLVASATNVSFVGHPVREGFGFACVKTSSMASMGASLSPRSLRVTGTCFVGFSIFERP